MASLSLSTNELHRIASGPVPDEVKASMLDQLGVFGDRLDQKGATALAEWAASRGRRPNADAIVTLALRGGAANARSIVRLLGAQALTIDVESLKTTLEALQAPYRQLTHPGRDRPKVPMSEGVVPVLARLQTAGIVSKYEENRKQSVLEVSKRHS
jgi:hypothetical protein